MNPIVIYHQLLLVSIFSIIIQKENGKILWAFCRGNQGDGNFRVGLQNYIIPGALYSRTHIFLTGFIHLKALDIQPGQTGKYSPFVSQSFPPKAFPSEGPCMCNYFPNPHPCTLTSDVSPLFPRRI